MNKGLLAAILIIIIVVATLIPLIAFNVIPLSPRATNSPSPTLSPTANPSLTGTPSPSTTPTPAATSVPQTYGVLIGTTIDTSGNVLADVTVKIGVRTEATNDQGWFSVADVTPGNMQIVKFSKTGYVSSYKVANIKEGESSFLVATLKPIEKIVTFDATQGATITNPSGNSYVTIDANALITRLGAIFLVFFTASMTTFDPTNENDANAFPGEYIGQTASGSTAPIKSFGFMDIALNDQNGEELQLAQGKPATLSIHVPSDLQAEATAMGSCPLWYFDTTAGIWKEEGEGTYDAGSGSFTGVVNHLSTWNYELTWPASYISGRVVDSNGIPVSGAQVKCWGRGWTYLRWASGETSTNSSGAFVRIPVESGVVFKYQASKGGRNSAILQTGPLEKDQEYNVGDIILDAPLIQITLTWGLNPEDLDSHLTANLDSGSTIHVYYDAEGALTSAPFANLDTDDTDSYGPEVVSISKLQAGTYRYCIRHFDGDGTISTSGAEVNLVIPNLGIYRYTPPSNQPANTDIWRIFDLVISSTGTVIAVNNINDYVSGGDTASSLYP